MLNTSQGQIVSSIGPPDYTVQCRVQDVLAWHATVHAQGPGDGFVVWALDSFYLFIYFFSTITNVWFLGFINDITVNGRDREEKGRRRGGGDLRCVQTRLGMFFFYCIFIFLFFY